MRSFIVAAGAAGVLGLDGCSGGGGSCKPPGNPESPEIDASVCAATAGPFSTDLDHEFLPLAVGAVHVLQGVEHGVTVRVEITALAETQVVAGVATRVVQERESEDGVVVEISRNFMAMTTGGTLCYFGETVDDYENGVIVGHPGEWAAGVDGAEPGILLPASPSVGQWYRQETAPGIAEDRALHTAMGEPVTVASGTYSDTLRVLEWSPLECGTSDKLYARGVGMIFDDGVERQP